MTRAEQMHRAVDVAEAIVPEEGWTYSITSSGWVQVDTVDRVDRDPPSCMGLSVQADPYHLPGGWYGGADDGVWQRTWEARIHGVRVCYYQRHSVAICGPLPERRSDDEATP